MTVFKGMLRLGSALLFVVAVEEAIHARPLDVLMLLSVSVLLLVVAETVSARQHVE